MRCLSLAGRLRGQRAEVRFMCSDMTAHLAGQIEALSMEMMRSIRPEALDLSFARM
jgi:hypothetical protein